MITALRRILGKAGPFIGLALVIILFAIPQETRVHFLSYHNIKINRLPARRPPPGSASTVISSPKHSRDRPNASLPAQSPSPPQLPGPGEMLDPTATASCRLGRL